MTALLRCAGCGVGRIVYDRRPRLSATSLSRLAAKSIGATLAAICLFGGSAHAQMVPVPDPEPEPRQVTISPSNAPPRPIPAVPTPAPQVAVPQVTAPPAEVGRSPIGPPSTGPAVVGHAPVGRYALLLHDGTRLIGVPGHTKAVPFDAVFGSIEIPMASIREVDFVCDANGLRTHRIYFVNGDSLTGSVGRLGHVRFQTSYGELTVPMTAMVRLRLGGDADLAAMNRAAPSSQAAPDKSAASVSQSRPVPVPFADDAPGPIRPPRPDIDVNAEVR